MNSLGFSLINLSSDIDPQHRAEGNRLGRWQSLSPQEFDQYGRKAEGNEGIERDGRDDKSESAFACNSRRPSFRL